MKKFVLLIAFLLFGLAGYANTVSSEPSEKVDVSSLPDMHVYDVPAKQANAPETIIVIKKVYVDGKLVYVEIIIIP